MTTIEMQNYLIQQLELIGHAMKIGNDMIKSLPQNDIRAISVRESVKRLPKHHESILEKVNQLNDIIHEQLKENGYDISNVKKDLENILK